jgi:hypothetical protein
MDSYYRSALDKAVSDLAELNKKEHEIMVRKAQLRETVKALRALCGDLPDVNSLNLSDAIRLVFSGASEPMTAIEVRTKLQELGYEVTKLNNPLAHIHTAIKRMVDAEEILWHGEDEDMKKLFEPGEKLKTPALESLGLTLNDTISEIQGLSSEGKKK